MMNALKAFGHRWASSRPLRCLSTSPTVGVRLEVVKKIGEGEVSSFAELSGDKNPIHLDEAAAKKSRFGAKVAHGMIGASLFSGLLGTAMPGSIYIDQTLQFTAPVFVGETVRAEVVLEDFVTPAKARFTTTVFKEDGSTAITGQAHALLPRNLRKS